MAGVAGLSEWVATQIRDCRPGGAVPPRMAIGSLLRQLRALRGGDEGGVLFGKHLHAEPGDETLATIQAEIVDALVAWRDVGRESGDKLLLVQLSDRGRELRVDQLVLAERYPLMCDPLGARDGLDAAWMGRLQRLDQAAIRHSGTSPTDCWGATETG